MGLALRKEAISRHTSRPRLRAVPHPKPVRQTKAARAAAARDAFRTFALLALIVAVLGVGRVWLSVKAAEASLEASELRSDIKNERYEGDMLEVRQSALGSPSRIRAIAGSAMGMQPARKVTYIDFSAPKAGGKQAAVVADSAPRGESGFDKLLAEFVDVTAGEAQVLLVGDVGLASAK